MKNLRRVLGALVLLLLLARFSGYGYLIRGMRATYLAGHSTANIYDFEHYDLRAMPAVQPLPLVKSEATELEMSPQTMAALEETQTASLLVLKNDSVVLERYWGAHNESAVGNSFSMAKTVITLLVQIAIQDGYINSWDDPVLDYVPELQGGEERERLTLRHLSAMTAGLEISENYKKPWAKLAKYYYGSDVIKTTLSTPTGKFEPGTQFEYQSASTQLLTLALSRAVQESVSSYANRELFAKVGFESEAFWHLDQKDGLELGFCCLNAATRDFAKLGNLVLNHGYQGEHAVIDSSFLHHASRSIKSPVYGQSFWIYQSDPHIFAFRGMLGQLIIMDPANDLVVVRTGQKDGPKDGYFHQIERVLLEQMAQWYPH